MTPPIISDVVLRAYFAAVIGGFRQVYGRKSEVLLPAIAGASADLADNATSDRVLSVLISRADTLGAATSVLFTQNGKGAGGSSDFALSFGGSTVQRFVLMPGDKLAIQQTASSPAAARFVIQQETW